MTPPTLDEWLEGLEATLGRHSEAKPRRGGEGAQTLGLPAIWDNLADAEAVDLGYAGAASSRDVEAQFPWMRVAREVSAAGGFFHWELDFAGVFARGGFDLQVGNPPWVRPDFDSSASLAEHDVWFALTSKPSTKSFVEHRTQALEEPNARSSFVADEVRVVGTRAFVSAVTNYPHVVGLRPDLYRCFMERTWRHLSQTGIVALIHPETHFTDEKAGALREVTYSHLRRHWQFVNELSLFEVHHLVSYGVHVYGARQEPRFLMATNLYHPETVVGSLRHDGSGPEPGLKTDDGSWDLRPHRNRISHVDATILRSWHTLLEDDATPAGRSRMLYAVNRSTADVLAKISTAPRLAQFDLETSQGWNETTDFNHGYFTKEWGPVDSWEFAILQGPHIFVGNPFYKWPNPTLLHNLDWAMVDLEQLDPDALPVTAYKPARSRAEYDAAYTHWGADRTPARNYYRVVWRKMAANTGLRTLIPAVIPPGAAPTHGLSSVGLSGADHEKTVLFIAGVMSGLLTDLQVRAAPKANLPSSIAARLAFGESARTSRLYLELIYRSARLNCLTHAYAEMWTKMLAEADGHIVEWAGGLDYIGRLPLASDGPWRYSTPLRRDSDRRQAQLEIDAIIALSLGITADELCTVYRTQFAVLYGYDRNAYFYDANGRLVPNEVLKTWRQKGDAITLDERTATNASGNTYEYELPFVTLDREADMRQAYAHFERILKERS